MPLQIGPTTLTNVVLTHDGGHDCYDTTISAQDIYDLLNSGQLKYDPNHQRGHTDTKVPEPILKKEKVERWTRALQKDDAIFGQLAWNFRPETSGLKFRADMTGDAGDLEVTGVAYLPDSYHRHMAIHAAVKSISNGSTFDPSRRFSLRIWNVPEEFENRIFHDMNQEHDKADATRSKYLHQRGLPQKLAMGLVQQVSTLGEDNVETIRNVVSAKSPRLVAFNTISTGFERTWDLPDDTDPDEVLPWLVEFWNRLTLNIPELGRVNLVARTRARKNSIAASAVAIHAYIHLAWKMYKAKTDLALLDKLGAAHREGYFNIENEKFQNTSDPAKGIVIVTGKDKEDSSLVLRTRNSRLTQDTLTYLISEIVGV